MRLHAHHLALLPLAWAQFVPFPTDLTTVPGAAGTTVRFKTVPPGICELNPSLKTIAGYVDVSTTQHMYFLFFESRTQPPTSAPLTVRLDGGPGSSSMNGLFAEIGPCTISPTGSVVNNTNSWSSVGNLLFVDQPSTVGFSYTSLVNGTVDPRTARIVPQQCTPADPRCGTYSSMDLSLTPNSTTEAAKVFYQVMQGFLGAFPQYAKGGVHINGQSYGGHYAPIFASHILSQNALNLTGTVPIPIKSISIEDGFMDARQQFASYLNYSASNPYDLLPFNSSQKAQLSENMFGAKGCQPRLTACVANPTDATCADADAFCISAVEEFWDVNTGRSENDIRVFAPDPYPPTNYVAYLNSPAVQTAIGASTNFTVASVQTSLAFSATGDDTRTSPLVVSSIATLLQNNISVALFTGDADYDSNLPGAIAVSSSINAPNWASAGFVDLSPNSEGQVPGQVRQADGFSLTRLYFAGHFSAFQQPEAALRIQDRLIRGVDIATGTTGMFLGKGLITRGPAESTFKQGNATVQTGPLPKGVVYDPRTHLPVFPPAAAAVSVKADVAEDAEGHPLAGMTAKKIRKMLREDGAPLR
ncbi:carboxypeptidase S1 [Colletotrichum musicola]|uniref:Carboxypeptidase S1 n=1 Tax=Colletotrichum musicola TaxID=2175873 RepID=A0A8H6N0G9_9PEZI|nr:carboxypeptidase S1 [Colletotrichum musicola]